MGEGTSFWQSLVIHWRVVRALLMREIITRYGRHNIGFFWLFAEPGLFCCGVMVIRAITHENVRGLPLAAYVFTGYSTILLWRNCGNRCSTLLTPNLSLLYHRNVRIIDVVLARIILELSGCALAFTVLLTIFVSTGLVKPLNDWTLLLAAYLLFCCYAASLGVWVCAMTELSEVWERIWHPLTYFMLPFSGLGFMVDWLPIKYQKMAVYVPMIDGCEMLRDGFFGNQVRCHYSVPILICWCLALLLTGLILLKKVAAKVEPQ